MPRTDTACVKVGRQDRAGRVGAPRPAELPLVNLLVQLIPPAADGRPAFDGSSAPELASRVEDVVPGNGRAPLRLLVAAPRYPGDVLEPEPGARWQLSWVTERGRWLAPVRLEERVRVGERAVRSWWISLAGTPERDQRRRYYRANCALPIEVDVLADPYVTLLGRTLDLSEGGLRAVLPATGLTAGTRVIVRLRLEDVPRRLDAVVHRSRRPSPRARVAGWHREIALAFDDPDRDGDVLRQAIYRMQLRARRLAVDGD